MPRHYDELYLNEEWNKGFVHVDVDKMAEGEPFVFNSGAVRNDGDIIISPAPAAAATSFRNGASCAHRSSSISSFPAWRVSTARSIRAG